MPSFCASVDEHARDRVAHLAELLEQAELRLQHARRAGAAMSMMAAPNFMIARSVLARIAEQRRDFVGERIEADAERRVLARGRPRSGGRRRARSCARRVLPGATQTTCATARLRRRSSDAWP